MAQSGTTSRRPARKAWSGLALRAGVMLALRAEIMTRFAHPCRAAIVLLLLGCGTRREAPEPSDGGDFDTGGSGGLAGSGGDAGSFAGAAGSGGIAGTGGFAGAGGRAGAAGSARGGAAGTGGAGGQAGATCSSAGAGPPTSGAQIQPGSVTPPNGCNVTSGLGDRQDECGCRDLVCTPDKTCLRVFQPPPSALGGPGNFFNGCFQACTADAECGDHRSCAMTVYGVRACGPWICRTTAECTADACGACRVGIAYFHAGAWMFNEAGNQCVYGGPCDAGSCATCQMWGPQTHICP